MRKIAEYIAVLKNKEFSLLWISQIASELAYQMVTFSTAVLIYQETGNTLYVSLIVILVSVAPILFSTIAGFVADGYDRRKVMIVSHSLRLLLGIGMLFFFPFPLILLPITFLLASVAQFFEPAQASSIPALLPEHQLFIGNSFFSFTRYAMFLVGYTIAGPLLVGVGPSAIFLIIIGLYIVCLLSAWRVRPLREHLPLDAAQSVKEFKKSIAEIPKKLKEGFAFMMKDKVVAFLMFQVSFIFAVERGFISLAPAFALDWLAIDVSDISLYLILPTGLGTLAGTVATNFLKHRVSRNMMVTGGTLLDGFALVSLAVFAYGRGSFFPDTFSATIVAIVILAFLSGFADPFIIVPAQTVVQERTPKEKRGRIFGNLVLMMNLLGLIPIATIGVLSRFVPIVSIVAGLGVLIVIVGFIGVLYWRKFRLEPELRAGI